MCLLADFVSNLLSHDWVIVSWYVTDGSDTTISHWANSLRSFKQISMWSSPEPATVISPVSYFSILIRGSDLESLFRPFSSFCKSAAFLHFTATL